MADIFSLASYDYALPPELIATHPVSPRDAAKLLVWPRGAHRVFSDLSDELNPGDVLVVNDSRVIPARLRGLRRGRDARGIVSPDVPVEFLLHRPQGDFATWTSFARPAKRLKPDDIVQFADNVTARILGREGDQVVLQFDLAPDGVEAFLQRAGEMPLPPYIDRGEEAADKAEYQTVYAQAAGSVAAPTAGLHFTDALLGKIRARGVHILSVTLHVGAGTFLPVTVDDVRQHKMHSEWGTVPANTAAAINAARARGNAVVAVGTTAARLLESAARETGAVQAWQGDTDIFITPGFQFRAVDRLVTNFHLPKSTLLMLVAAFLGGVDAAQALYQEAIAQCYRFYSYGDAALLTRAKG